MKVEGARLSSQKKNLETTLQGYNSQGEKLDSLLIHDNGMGMSPLALHRMLSFGHCEKVILYLFMSKYLLFFYFRKKQRI